MKTTYLKVIVSNNQVDPFVKVHFRKDQDGNVFAFFPELEGSPGLKSCYAHIGQHSSCAEEYAFQECKYATLAESKDLINELVLQVHYNLSIQVNYFFEALDIEKCKKIVEETKEGEIGILCSHYSINIQSKYYQDEDLEPEAMDFDFEEFQEELGHWMEVNEYDDLIISKVSEEN